MGVITLITDFGIADEYVGVMKGVVLGICPSARVVDITHGIGSQDLVRAAYMAESSYRYFPDHTVHVIVVDPGVGTDRAILAVQTGRHVFLAPDNGVLTLVAESERIDQAVRVEDPKYFLSTVSRTFHGRDIFAPVAAHLSNGTDIANLGPRTDPANLKKLDIEKPFMENMELHGSIVSVDRFGNLITNIGKGNLEIFCERDMKKEITVEVGGKQIEGLAESYGGCAPKTPLSIIGSKGYLEISVNCGNAADFFNVRRGGRVRIMRNRT